MGGGIPLGLIFLLVVIVLTVIGLYWVRPWARQRQRLSDHVNAPSTPTLDYRVPAGQDPAVVMAALTGAGYEAAVDPHDAHRVRVDCPAGPDEERSRVREVIAGARSTAIDAGKPARPDTVVFEDEL